MTRPVRALGRRTCPWRAALLATVLVACAGTTTSDDDLATSPSAPSGAVAGSPTTPPEPDVDDVSDERPQVRLALDDPWTAECRAAGVPANPSPEEVLELSVEMRPRDVDDLYARDPESNDRVDARYRIRSGDEVVSAGSAEVRFRGNSSRHLAKKSFNIVLDRADPEFATDRLNLNAMYTDPSMVREWLSFAVFSELGVPTSRTRFVDVYLNDVYEGLYLHVQRVDERLLVDAGLDPVDPTLVRDRSRQVLDGHGSIFEEFVSPLSEPDDVMEHLPTVMDSRGDPDWSAVADLALWLQPLSELDESALAADAEHLEAALASRVDVDGLIDFAVGHVLVGDVDWFSDDYWLVRATPSDTFRLVPWDKDLTFGSHWSEHQGRSTNHFFHLDWALHGRMLERNPITRVALALPAVRQRFHERLDEALSDGFTTRAVCERLGRVVPPVSERVDRRAPGDGFERHGQQHFAEAGEHHLHVSTVLDYVQRRSAFLSAALEAERDGRDVPVRSPDDTMDASIAVSSSDVGSSLWFTDESGWTIARLDVHDVIRPGDVTVRVSRDADRCDAETCDVDRVWTVETGGAALTGRLSLYFRNNVAHGNWYRTSSGVVDAVGDQRDLAVVEVGRGASEPHSFHPLESRSNPYADRVMALVELDGTHAFVLDEPLR